jgi:hypothetical protein
MVPWGSLGSVGVVGEGGIAEDDGGGVGGGQGVGARNNRDAQDVEGSVGADGAGWTFTEGHHSLSRLKMLELWTINFFLLVTN